MTKSSLMIGSALLAMVIALPAGAEMAGSDGKRNVSEPSNEASSSAIVAPAQLASQLAAWGREANDPVALVQAARIRTAAGEQTVKREKQSEGGSADTGKKGNTNGPDTVESLLAAASAMAGDSEVIAALVDEVKSSSNKGAVGGAKSTVDRVRAGATDVFRINYRGGEEAEVAVMGDGDTDLDLYVYDENGNLICSDTDNTDRMYCSWYPRWTGQFQIKIRNYGSVYNEYAVVTN
jgi:hypothetical protein